ncbi:aminomethyl-transferring glycine dehydrogenase subunit GcvPA [Candidatus Izemoplasma sp. B36]|uniref:aminomethyl-transferring glycine dehydrogenase subunit GcvPA n=1 Tax=Candidatus Izemoplasma sp. B36 TaxID=3242468 RepID=UPI003558FBD9
MFKYFPHTKEDINHMLKELNISSIDELFGQISKEVLLKGEYDIKNEMSELEVRNYFRQLSDENQEMVVFSGLGLYDHYQPAIIDAITSRQEFLTSYTPYQPEISQGTLQYIFEYQSMIQALTGLDVSNASMYDGSTATAEACFMACNITRRKKVLISKTLNPNTINVIKTYLKFRGYDFEFISSKNGVFDVDDLKEKMNKEIAGVVVQNPNFFGLIEDYSGVSEMIHEYKSLFIQNRDPSTLGVLKSPSEDGADIACGDCQSLGAPLAFGGPTLGYLATIKKHVRKLPGRICGYTTDSDGKRAFVLTLQAREQHIRRSKANSNICSNQSLMALYVTVYTSIMGKAGLEEVNNLSYQNAHYLYEKLLKTKKFFDPFKQPFLKEFTLETTISHDLISEALFNNNIFGGFSLESISSEYENLINFCVTEKRTKAEIDKLIEVLEGLS